MSTQTVMSPFTMSLLRNSGWTPGRTTAVDRYATALREAGYDPLPVVLDFLKNFGDLRVEHPHAKVPDTIDFFHLNPIKALESVTRNDVGSYEERVAERLCVIGEAFREYMVLMMAESGTVYAAYDDTLVRVGDSGEDALEALCTGRELEHMP